jgi:S-formylglutathione hydrolase FrmB
MDLKHFHIRHELFESRVLAANPLGDPPARRIPVCVPASHERERGRRYPVVYLLAGFTGSAQSFLNWKAWSPSVPERLDALREKGAIGDVIAVFPDAFTRYGGSQYIDSSATGRYETMLVEELVPFIDERFRTLAACEHRGILGKSSGGYGALVLGMRHPDVFSAVACHSGDMYFEYCYRVDFPRLLRQMDRSGGLDGFLEEFFAAPKKTSELVLAMNIVAMAAAYSPDPAAPRGFVLPFDPHSGEIDEKVWSRWLAHDPVRLCSRHVEELKRLKLLYLDCGKRDQFHLQYGLRILSARLRALGVIHQAEEFDDDHTDVGYRYDVSLPLVWEAIRRTDA